jgi:hypothetical protein
MKTRIKRQKGQFFTVKNPFHHCAFSNWAEQSGLPSTSILEPFAGANSLIKHLQNMGLCNESVCYDIEPSHKHVQKRDTLECFPNGFDVCITNPPWLAKNSATVRGLSFPNCRYDDLYKFALEKCLDNCKWVAALVPESFIRAGIFQERLTDFISLTSQIFADTGHPVGLALFQPHPSSEIRVWSQDFQVGYLSELESLRPQQKPNGPDVRFNHPHGNVGLIALDNTYTASIRFCPVDELAKYTVKNTGRHITKMYVEGNIQIEGWNEYLDDFRNRTHDVLMTCYKGIRKDGMYRRRLDWNLARGIIHNVGAYTS